MKKEAVGDITRSGGFSRLIRDVETSNEPIIIMKSNHSVAAVVPCPPGMERYLTDSMAITKAFTDLIVEGRTEEGLEFLLLQAAVGDFAKTYLTAIGVDLSFIRAASDAVSMDIGKIAREFIQKNSSEDSRSVSPMTTTSADVSEVKQEELSLGNSSLSRKRGKKSVKKEASSPQKRKIGTKRETSA